jgi:5-methylcytosine-specific restriction endonuclease McrA
MTRLKFGPEPSELAQVRIDELSRVRLIAAHASPSGKQVGTKYRLVARDLWDAQSRKCCYCEFVLQAFRYNDVEHFRPKANAARLPGSAVQYGYWWLAWTWENLLFSCPLCNRTYKNDQFPLEVGSAVMLPEDPLPGPEQAILIDPRREDPVDHIHFRPFDHERRWIPMPRNGSQRGLTTINVLALDRPELLDFYERHVRDLVVPAVNATKDAMALGPAQAQDAWTSRVLPLFKPHREFHGLTFDAIEHLIPRSIRDPFGLNLPRP